MTNRRFRDSDAGKLQEERDKYKYKCSCGHTVYILPFEHRKKKVCSWCGYYVYTSKEAEFKDRMKQRLKGA